MEKRTKIYLIIFIVVLIILSLFIFDNDSASAELKKKEVKKGNTVYVDIKGAVKKPGVYEISSDSRIIDVIEKAGNLKKEADTSIINLSKKVKDEMFIIIYTKEEVNKYKENMNSSEEIVEEINSKIICPDTDNDACINKDSSKKVSSKVNINNATIEELTSLSGIGESKAKKIIEYREKNKFEKKDDILNVSGIGKSLYEKIKDNIEI